MKPVDFPQSTSVLAKDQPEYLPLPVRVEGNTTISCWELSNDEKATILRTGRIWLSQMNFKQPLQPQLPSADPPFPIIPG